MNSPKAGVVRPSTTVQYWSTTLVVERPAETIGEKKAFPEKKLLPHEPSSGIALLPKSYQLIRYWIELDLSTHIHSRIVLGTNCFGRTTWLTSHSSDLAMSFWL